MPLIKKKYMEAAIDAAKAGIRAGDGGPFGCCIIDETGTVLAVAHNEVLKQNDATRHAEIICISRASQKRRAWDLSGCILFSTTECCPMCYTAAHWARVTAIVYGTTISDVAQLGFNELPVTNEMLNAYGTHRVRLYKEYWRDECRCLLDEWKCLAQKQIY